MSRVHAGLVITVPRRDPVIDPRSEEMARTQLYKDHPGVHDIEHSWWYEEETVVNGVTVPAHWVLYTEGWVSSSPQERRG